MVPARLRFDWEEQDLGRVVQYGLYTAEFPFRVEGAEPVTVTEFKRSCGCVDPALEVEGEPWPLDKPIPAGSRGKVSAVFDSKDGSKDKRVSVTVSSQPRARRDALRIHAFILPLFELDPVRARFGLVKRGEGDSMDMQLTSIRPFEVTGLTGVPEGVQVEELEHLARSADGEGQVRWFRVSIADDAPIGDLAGNFLIETSLGRNLDVFVSAEVVGRVRYLPGEHRVTFGILPEGSTATRTIRLTAIHPGDHLPLPELELSGDDRDLFTAEAVAAPEGGSEITVRYSGAASVGWHEALLKVRLPGDLESESRDLPISIIVREAGS